MPLKIKYGGEKKMWWIGIIVAIVIGLFVRFTIVEEGTAKIIMRFGGVVKVFIQWTGYKLDEKGNVVLTKEKIPKRPWYSGLRVWIGLPVDKVHKFKLRWHSVEEVEGKRIPVFHEEVKNYVLLRPDRYWRKSLRMETNDGQFPDVEWLIGMRSINPEKTIFKSPHNWVENALTQLEPLLRRYVYTKTLKELLDLTREKIWQDIGNDRTIKTVLKSEWGIQIDDQEIGVFDVAPPPGYQEALAARSKAEMEAEAERRRAEIEAFGRAASIMETTVQSLSVALGKSKKVIQKTLWTDPEGFTKKYGDIIERTWIGVINKLSMEERSYLRIETPGAEGALGDFLRLIGAWKRMPMGKPPERRRPPAEEKGRRKLESTPETIEEERERFKETIKKTLSKK